MSAGSFTTDGLQNVSHYQRVAQETWWVKTPQDLQSLSVAKHTDGSSYK